MTNLPWMLVLPVVVLAAFLIGTIWKRIQDRTVTAVRNTIRPGSLNVAALQKYADGLKKTA